MRAALAPEAAAAVEAARAAGEEMGATAYLVGGAVRALLEGRKIRDLDIVVDGGDGVELARRLAKRLGGEVSAHPQFLTGSVALPGGLRVDVSTARRERYPHPAALPVVEPATILDDLRRRDFTVNALGLRLGGPWDELLDPHGGREDLRHRSLRVLHDGSFRDDPTRIFRGVRLEVEQGFNLSPETEALASAAAAGGAFDGLSGSRLREEMKTLLDNAELLPGAVDRLAELGLLAAIDPDLRLDRDTRPRLERLASALGDHELWREGDEDDGKLRRPSVWLTALTLLAISPARLARRLDLSGRPAEELERAAETARAAAAVLRTRSPSPAEVDRQLAPLSALELALLLAADDEGVRASTGLYLRIYRRTRLSIRGDDLMAEGVPPGPAVGRALAQTRAARLDGRIDRSEELAFALRAARALMSAPASAEDSR